MLEALPRDDIALLSLAPDARKGQLRISAEARDLEAMLAFHQRLEASAELSDVSLLNHEVKVKQPERPILFNLLATWEVGDARP
jgi:Tfp pilus assembly protein PilN